MEVPEETMEQMRSIKVALDDLEQHMQPFLEAAPKQVTSQLTPLERVKVHLALAQAVVTLYQLHRKLAAAKLDNHPLQKELERLAAYEKKVQKAVTADDLARSRPGSSLNVAAANRFIDAAIPDLNQEQKQALRNLGKRVRDDKASDPAAAAAAAAAGNGDGSNDKNASCKKRSVEQQQRPQSSSRAATAPDSDDDNDDDSDDHQQQQQQQQCVALGSEGLGSKNLGSKGLGSKAAADAEAAQFLQEVLAESDSQGT